MVIPLTFDEVFMIVLFDNVASAYPLTFDEDRHVLGCDICLTTLHMMVTLM